MVDLLEARRRILLNTPHLESLSGATASFETDISAKLKECKVYFTPVQEGSGDPSLDNVRPIHGWDGVTVTRCGKNLINYVDLESIRLATSATLRCKESADYGSIVITDSVVTLTRIKEAAGLCFILGELKAGVTYTLSGTWDNTDGKAYIALLDTDIADEYSCTRKFTINFYNNTATFTPEETGVYEVLIWRGGRYTISASNVQLEVGSTATDYEPYAETSLTIPFPQTIYGGYVDLVKGEVVEEWKEYIYSARTNVFTDHGNGYYEVGFGDVGGKGYGSASNSMCSKLSYGFRTSTPKVGYELNYVLLGRSNRFHTLVYSDTPMTKETARQWFIDNNIQLVRLVYTPTAYSLDPQTIRTLKGINNIWSNANGNIEVKFWTH